MKIYIASSWQNPYLDDIASILNDRNHQVHDFRANGSTRPAAPPFPGAAGSAGNQLEGSDGSLDSVMSRLHLTSTQTHYQLQCAALVEAEVLLCVLPGGRSAHVELGMALGLSIPAVLVNDGSEPDLMDLGVDAVVGLDPAGEFPSRNSRLTWRMLWPWPGIPRHGDAPGMAITSHTPSTAATRRLLPPERGGNFRHDALAAGSPATATP